MNTRVLEQINWIYKDSPVYRERLVRLNSLYEQGKLKECQELAKQFPTTMQLLDKLVNKLEGKPVQKTLKRIVEGKEKGDWEKLKGYFSLGTHACIEAEKDQPEYRALLFEVWEKIGTLIR